MFSFIKNEKNEISLTCNDIIIIEKITPWVNTRLHPWFKDEENRINLSLENVSDKKTVWADMDGAVRLTLSLEEDGEKGLFAIRASGCYIYNGNTCRGTHLNSFEGFGFDFGLSHNGNFVNAYMNCAFWQRNSVTDSLGLVRPRSQAILFRNSCLGFGYILCTCDKQFKSEIFPHSEEQLRLAVHSNTLLDSVDSEIVLVGGTGDDPYILAEKTADFGLQIMKKPGRIRKEKKYPNLFEYLGWCSWDAFHMDVSEEGLMAKAEEFKNKKIPVNWFILDDMWGDVTGNSLEHMHTRELNSFEAGYNRFPGGLKGCISKLKEKYDLKIGIWHPINGYWFGINPLGRLASEHGDLLEFAHLLPQPRDPMLLHSFDYEKIVKYYDIQHAFYKECGADFTKIDNQSSAENYSHFKMSIGQATKNLHFAIDGTAEKYYDGNLINCMGMAIENFWNRTSAVSRFSGDFKPEDRKWFTQHLLQCSYNAVTQGALYYGDWDMWWSDDGQAVKNSVIRAMSGGPVYVSDELGRSRPDVIMPVVFSDGRIIRLKGPALPTPDCLFEDAERNGRIFKIFNRHGEYGIVGAFNIDCNEKTVFGSISPADAMLDIEKEYAVYEWFTKKVSLLKGNDSVGLKLDGYDSFGLFVIAPVINGTAILGLRDKYMMPATFVMKNNVCTSLDEGILTVYSENAPRDFADEGGNIYSKHVKKDEKTVFE